MTTIGREEVEKLCQMSHLELNPEEMAAVAGELDEILEAFSHLAKVDITSLGIESPSPVPLRKDTRKSPLPRKEVLDQAPHVSPPYFLAPSVLPPSSREE